MTKPKNGRHTVPTVKFTSNMQKLHPNKLIDSPYATSHLIVIDTILEIDAINMCMTLTFSAETVKCQYTNRETICNFLFVGNSNVCISVTIIWISIVELCMPLTDWRSIVASELIDLFGRAPINNNEIATFRRVERTSTLVSRAINVALHTARLSHGEHFIDL